MDYTVGVDGGEGMTTSARNHEAPLRNTFFGYRIDGEK